MENGRITTPMKTILVRPTMANLGGYNRQEQCLLPNDGGFNVRPVLKNKEDAEFGVMADSSFPDEIEDSEGTYSSRLGTLDPAFLDGR
jgi:hypothetical protein